MLATDHRFFVQEVWKDRGLDKKAPLGDVEYEMIDWVMTGVTPEGGYERMRGILGTRGMGKTTLLVAPLIVYRGFRDPNRKIFVVSKSATEAKNTIGLCREWLDYVWFLKHMAPQKGQPDNTNFFDFGNRTRGDVKQESVKAIGNDGQLESNRAHTYIMDDAETKGNTRTLEAREELIRTVANEATNIVYAIDDAVDPCEILDIGTLKCEDSFHKRLHVRGYKFITYPIAYPQEGDQFINLSPILSQRLASGEAQYTVDGKYDENPTFPNFFSPKVIKERMGAGLLDFGMENMLLINPGKQTGPPLKLSQLIVMPIERDQAPVRVKGGGEPIRDIAAEGLLNDRLFGPDSTDTIRAPYQTIEAAIDIAGEGNDLMGLSIAGYLNGMYFVKMCKGLPGGASEETMNGLATLLRFHGARRAWVETNIDVLGTFVPALQAACDRLRVWPGQSPQFPMGWACNVDGFHATGVKEIRICQTIGPLAGTGRIVIDPSVLRPDITVEQSQSFQYQWTRIRPIRKWLKEDGAIDSLGSLFHKLQEGTAGNRADPEKGRPQQEKLRIQALVNECNRRAGKPKELLQTIDLS